MTLPYAALLPLVLVARLGALDLTGTWRVEWKPDFSGHPQTLDCRFRQEGEALTIRCGEATMHGRVKGRTVTFEHKTGRKNEVTATYKGTLDARGALISGSWHLSRPQNRSGKFSARRN